MLDRARSFKLRKTRKQLVYGVALVLSLVLLTFLTPVFKKSFIPYLANAAQPTITRLSQTIGQTSGGDKVIIYGSNFEILPSATPYVISMSTGAWHTCVLTNENDIYCWGKNYYGQLGNNKSGGSESQFSSGIDSETPVLAHLGNIPSGTALKQISTGHEHTCVLTVTGDAYCWGRNNAGATGDGTTTQYATPRAVTMPSGVKFKQIQAGSNTTCAISTNNRVYCWGQGGSGQIGDGMTNSRTTPTLAQLGQIPVGSALTSIDVGGNQACVTADNGKAYCWGSDYYGQLGNGSGGNSSTPVLVVQGEVPDGVNLTKVATGFDHTCALGSDNKVYCWGRNQYCQSTRDIGNTIQSPVANQLGDIPAGTKLIDVVAAGLHTCALGANDKVYCWGHNSYGQLGAGYTSGVMGYSCTPEEFVDTNITPKPYRLSTLSRSSHGDGTCLIASGKVYCWGRNQYGQVGNGSHTGSSWFAGGVNTPTAVVTNTTPPIPTNSSLIVKVGNTTLSDDQIRYISPYQIEITMPAYSPGTVDITIINSDHTIITKTNAYTYENPTTPEITSISPNEGLIYGGEEVTITGTNLDNFKWKQMASGYAGHNCAIGLDGKVYCWGDNSSGQLGTGNTNDQSTPVAIAQGDIPDNVQVMSITVGGKQTCAIANNNKVYCWGENYHGQLGNGSSGGDYDGYNLGIDSNVPIEIAQGNIPTNVAIKLISTSGIVSAGHVGFHTCAVGSNNQIYCWGVGYNETPTAVAQGDIPANSFLTNLSSGGDGLGHNCVITSDSQAYCWGHNQYGQLGDGTNVNKSTPVTVEQGNIPVGATLQQITAGDKHTCALGSDNQAYCWGINGAGQLGDGTSADKSTPVVVLPGAIPDDTAIQQIAAGSGHTCVIGSDNKSYCWGRNSAGQLGDGTNVNKSTPVTVEQGNIPDGVTLQQINAGDDHTCALGSDNKAYCWGRNGAGQLGDGTNGGGTNKSTPVAVKPGYVINFGNLTRTNLGLYYTASSLTNIQLKLISPAHLLDTVDITLYSTANNTAYNTLTQAYSFTNPPAPTITQVNPNTGSANGGNSANIQATNLSNLKLADDFTQITAGGSHTCALDSDNKAYCWGGNSYGQLGDSTNISKSTPVTVEQGNIPDGVTLQQISTGYYHTCALGSDNQAYCWGINGAGQLGDGTSGSGANKSTPVAVEQGAIPTNVTLQQIVAGGAHTCALGSDNKAYCWGGNSYGQLGDSTNISKSTPVAVGQGAIPTNVTLQQIVAGHYHTCAIGSDNKAYCWGYNSFGQIGDSTSGSGASKSAPVAVGQGAIPTNVTLQQIVAGHYHTCAIGSDNKAYCWGYNSTGQLGDGTTTQSTTPKATSLNTVFNGIIIQQICTYRFHTCALDSTGKAYCWGHNEYGQLGTNQSGVSLSMQRYTPAYVMMKFDPLEVSFGTTAEHTAGTAGLATAVSSFDVPTGQYYIPGTTTLTLNTPAHSVGPVAVVVKNADGQSSSNTIAADDSNKYTYTSVPDAPTNLTANATPTGGTTGINYQIDLSWTAPVSDGYSPITDYTIEYCESNSAGTCSGSWIIYNDGTSTATSATISSIPYSPSVYYTFRVFAVNAIGTSQPSNTDTVQTSFITLSSSADTVTINIDPSVSGSTNTFSSTTHNITVNTNHPTGYNVGLSTLGTNNNLVNSGNSSYVVTPATASASSPVLDLPVNTWGYRLNNTTFGTTTTLETNVSTSQYTWAKVQPSNTPDIIFSSNDPTVAPGTTIPIYYGMKVSNAHPSGTYTGIVRYTGVTQ